MIENLLNISLQKFKLNISEISEIIEITDSYSSKIYKIVLISGEKFILKIPYNRKKLLNEICVLNLLKHTKIQNKVPKVIDFFDDGTNCAMIISYLDGEPILGRVNKDISYQMGELLANLHNVKGNFFGDIGNHDVSIFNQNNWWEIIFKSFKDRIPLCEKALPKDLLYRCIDYFKIICKDLPYADGPCIVHMDYRPGNILIKDSKIVGLIDFETAKYGSADIDFTKIKLSVWDNDLNTKQAFLDGYMSVRNIPNFERTLLFYSFYEAFAAVAWCVKREKLNDSYLTQNIECLNFLCNN